MWTFKALPTDARGRKTVTDPFQLIAFLYTPRMLAAIREARPEVPIFCGGVVPPWAKKRLEEKGVEVYPPGSQLPEIVDAARRLTGWAGTS